MMLWNAHAVLSFARQTGASCNLCHTQSVGLSLTQCGRNFKLHGYVDNNNFTLDQASIFIAGRVLSHLGVFSQIAYDGVADIATLDNTELRG